MIVRRALLAGLVLGALAQPATAAADCSGPSISYATAPVPRGGTVAVTGTGWGDSCYDTGPPPSGEGILGKPQRDLIVLFVQDGEELLVAEGAADEDYGFAVDVPVPLSLQPGEATLIVRGPTGASHTGSGEPIPITDAPIVAGAPEFVTFGPAAPAPEAGPTPPVEADAEDEPPWLLLGVAVLPLLAVGVIVVVARRRARADE
jgi:hypothetical protein